MTATLPESSPVGPTWSYPPPVPPAAEPPTPSEPPRRPRRGLALVAAALIAGGAAGAGTALTVDHGSATTATSSGISTTQATVTDSGSRTVAGTPEAAAATIGPSVVTIAVTGTSSSGTGFGGAQTVSGTGSGIVLRADGYILTNNHVVSVASSGGTVSVTTSSGTTYPATVVGTDATNDLAVIRVTGASGLRAATFADSGELKVGQAVLAVGAPLGLSNTVTEGIVSTLHRPVRTGEAGATEQSVIDAVQTDAAINPGNSGGALVDLAGHVVGVNSAIATTGDTTTGSQSGNIGVGFAIPSNTATKIAQQLIASGSAKHPQIGVSVADATGTSAGTPGLGALVRAVTSGGPAASAGLQAGDVITKVDARVVTDADSLIVAVRDHDPGSTVTVTYTRGGATRTASVVLGTAS